MSDDSDMSEDSDVPIDDDDDDATDEGEEEEDEEEKEDVEEEEEEDEEEKEEEEENNDKVDNEDNETGSSSEGELSDGGSSRLRCPICLNRFIGQELGCPSGCSHTFCLECIYEWSKKISTCPLDRIEFQKIGVKLKFRGDIIKKVRAPSPERDVEKDIPEDTIACEVCGRSDCEDSLLLCDSCDLAYHCMCLSPPLDHIPVGEWFCPSCASVTSSTTNSRQTSLRTQRAIARTIVSERVRSRIHLYRTQAQWSTGFSRASQAARPTTTTKRTVKRRRKTRRRTKRKTTQPKLARTKKSVGATGKGKKSAAATPTKRKTKRRKKRTYKRRKTVKRTQRSQLFSRRLPVPTVRSRLAEHLGMCDPPPGHKLPYVKKSSNTGQQSSTDSIVPCSLFGDRHQLMDFDEDFTGTEATSSSSSSRAPKLSSPQCSVSQIDILGSIMSGQNLLHTDSKKITIKKDGSLELQKPEKPVKRQMMGTVKKENISIKEEKIKVLKNESYPSTSNPNNKVLVKVKVESTENNSPANSDAKLNSVRQGLSVGNVIKTELTDESHSNSFIAETSSDIYRVEMGSSSLSLSGHGDLPQISDTNQRERLERDSYPSTSAPCNKMLVELKVQSTESNGSAKFDPNINSVWQGLSVGNFIKTELPDESHSDSSVAETSGGVHSIDGMASGSASSGHCDLPIRSDINQRENVLSRSDSESSKSFSATNTSPDVSIVENESLNSCASGNENFPTSVTLPSGSDGRNMCKEKSCTSDDADDVQIIGFKAKKLSKRDRKRLYQDGNKEDLESLFSDEFPLKHIKTEKTEECKLFLNGSNMCSVNNNLRIPVKLEPSEECAVGTNVISTSIIKREMHETSDCKNIFAPSKPSGYVGMTTLQEPCDLKYKHVKTELLDEMFSDGGPSDVVKDIKRFESNDNKCYLNGIDALSPANVLVPATNHLDVLSLKTEIKAKNSSTVCHSQKHTNSETVSTISTARHFKEPSQDSSSRKSKEANDSKNKYLTQKLTVSSKTVSAVSTAMNFKKSPTNSSNQKSKEARDSKNKYLMQKLTASSKTVSTISTAMHFKEPSLNSSSQKSKEASDSKNKYLMQKLHASNKRPPVHQAQNQSDRVLSNSKTVVANSITPSVQHKQNGSSSVISNTKASKVESTKRKLVSTSDDYVHKKSSCSKLEASCRLKPENQQVQNMHKLKCEKLPQAGESRKDNSISLKRKATSEDISNLNAKKKPFLPSNPDSPGSHLEKNEICDKALLVSQIENAVKQVLKPYYLDSSISKEDYKDIMRKCVPKITKHSGSGVINLKKIQSFVLSYISLYTKKEKEN